MEDRKIICRYGRGCTHLNDLLHREQFWHPPIVSITDEQRRSYYICNECAFATQSLQNLQLHLKRKTAWSNASLVGCRISCLIDNKEWHEGYVSQFHRSGKHFVEFRLINERRWLNLKKVAFYIVERSNQVIKSDHGEYKENEYEEKDNSLAPLEDEWVYVEDVSLEYTYAQSILFKIYGCHVQETGHKTRGHICLTEDDRTTSQQMKGSLLYGELLPRGVNKALGPKRLCAQNARVLYDLGMGTGKVAIQAFLQYSNLQYIYGVELSQGRYSVAENAVKSLCNLLGSHMYEIDCAEGHYIQLTQLYDESGQSLSMKRILHLVHGDMFDTPQIDQADIIMLETDVPNHLQSHLCSLLSKLHEHAKALTYLDLKRIWNPTEPSFPFIQVDSNMNISDRYSTSWSVQRGHHFYLWIKDTKESSKCPSLTNNASSSDKNISYLHTHGHDPSSSSSSSSLLLNHHPSGYLYSSSSTTTSASLSMDDIRKDQHQHLDMSRLYLNSPTTTTTSGGGGGKHTYPLSTGSLHSSNYPPLNNSQPSSSSPPHYGNHLYEKNSKSNTTSNMNLSFSTTYPNNGSNILSSSSTENGNNTSSSSSTNTSTSCIPISLRRILTNFTTFRTKPMNSNGS